MKDKLYTRIIIKNLGFFFHRSGVTNYITNMNAYNDKPIIIICNHSSFTEPTAVIRTIYSEFGRIPRFMAMDKIFSWPIIGKIVRDLHFVPVKRDTSNASDALLPAKELLKNNEILALYPEGSLSIGREDDSVQKFKTGAARIALSDNNIIVIPMAQVGAKSGKINILKSLLLHPKLKIGIGEPIIISEKYYQGKDDTDTVKELTEIFRGSVEELRKNISEL